MATDSTNRTSPGPTLNPYAAPTARVDDKREARDEGFLPDGRNVPIGHGWTWIRAGWTLFMRQPGTWILMVIVLAILFVVIAVVQAGLGQIHPALNIASSIISMAVWPIVAGGLMLGTRTLDEGGDLEIAHLFAPFSSHAKPLFLLALATFVLSVVAAVVAVLLALGFGLSAMGAGSSRAGLGFGIVLMVLFMLALMLPVYMVVWFAPALVVLNDLPPLAAMKASFFGCLKNILPFLVFGIVAFVLAIFATIPFLLGWLAVAPVLIGALYAGYRDIFYA